MWIIRCGTCGHENDANRFFTSQKNRYACPGCGTVWRIELQGKYEKTESGLVIPPRKVTIIEQQMMLVTRS